LAEIAPHREIAGSPSRRPGNFLLRGQKKVTKEEALNRTPSRRREQPRARTQSGMPPIREPLRSRLPLVQSPMHRTITPLNARLHAGARQPEHRTAASLGRRCTRLLAGEPGVQPALSGVKGRWMLLFTGTAARAKRFASSRNARERVRAPLVAASYRYAVQRLFFGDFLLAPQKKVTPPPGGTPGNLAMTRTLRQGDKGSRR
jgi:hypothetical protein